MSEAMQHFGKLLVQAREEQGLSQLDVADIVDMDVRTIRAIESADAAKKWMIVHEGEQV